MSFQPCRAGVVAEGNEPGRDHTHGCSLQCPCLLVISSSVSGPSLAVWRSPASSLPQELYRGLLRGGGKQVSTKAGRGGRREVKWAMGERTTLPPSPQKTLRL